MTDVLVRVMALSNAAQRALALSLLGVCMLLVVGIILSAYGALDDLRTNIADARSNLARFELLLKQKPSDITPAASGAVTATDAFLTGGNDAVIQAGLQARVNASALAQNVMVASVGNAPALTIDGVQYIGVRADIQGALAPLNNTIFELETSQPPLIIKEATIRSTNVMGSEGLSAPLELAAEIVVYGAIKPQTGASAGGASPP